MPEEKKTIAENEHEEQEINDASEGEASDAVEYDEVKPEPSSNYSMEWLQWYYEKNKNIVNYVGGGLILIIGLFIGYKYYWLPGKEAEASDEIFYAQSLFEKDSFNLALNGGPQVRFSQGVKPMMGFAKIAEEYSYTKVGTLAHFYAGVCNIQLGKFEEAIKNFEKYDLNDEMLQPLAYGGIGDAYMELNKLEEGIKFYLKAANEKNNNFTTPLFLKKAGLALELKKNYAEALELFSRIKKEFPTSNEARDIEKFIARENTLLDLNKK